MSTFNHMAFTLMTRAPYVWPKDEVPQKGLSRSERIRRLIRAADRPVSAAEIAFDMDDHFPNFGSHLVWLLMKHDISKGRVIFDRGLYSWSKESEFAEATAIREAVKLLRRHGYKVTNPK